jgi:signal transduction histidine kinase
MSGESTRRARVLLAIEDVTERRLAEESLFHTSERYRLAEERLRVAMQAGKMGTWDWNMVTGSITWSWEHALMNGAQQVYQVKTHGDFFKHLVPEEKKEVTKQLQLAIDKKKDFSPEVRAVAGNGNVHWIAFLGKVFYAPEGNAYRMIGVVMDITERKAMEKQKEEFIGIASHELRTPVSSIKSYTQLLLDILSEKNDEDSIELVEKLHRQIDRLTVLITDLLDVTRINEGQLRLHKEPILLNELIMEVTGLVQRTTETHTIVFKPGDLPVISGDKERISQVLVNLLSNAIKYSPAADTVIVRTQTNNDQKVTVSVQDFGIGMSNATRKQVFERFFRGNEQAIKTYPGLGLGLYIAADIVHRHAGKIWVESEPEKGACFYFTLPVNQ